MNTLTEYYSTLINDYNRYDALVDWEWFYNLWEHKADKYDYYKLALTVEPNLSFARFDNGWQYRTVNHEDPEQARVEFINILLGWY